MDYEATDNQVYNLVNRIERRKGMLIETLSRIHELLDQEDKLYEDLGRMGERDLAKAINERIERDDRD